MFLDRVSWLSLFFLGTSVLFDCAAEEPWLSNYVDPNIGGIAQLLKPTRPFAHQPNCMVRVSPARFDYLDDQLPPFPLTVVSHYYNDLFGLLPDTDDLARNPDNPKALYDHDQEICRPDYYAVLLLDSQVKLEFAPGRHTGIYRLTFPTGKNKNVLLLARHGTINVSPTGVVEGCEDVKGVKAWVYGQFDQSGKTMRSFDKSSKVVVSFGADSVPTIEFRYSLSFISQAQAQTNWQREIAAQPFDKIRREAREKWETALGQIQVAGGTEAQRRTFYTALYRCYGRMVNISEDSRYFSGYDHAVHSDPRDFYVYDGIWDTYLALHPLHTILNPKSEADKIQSYIRMYEQSGLLPCFSELWGERAAMNSKHTTAMIADAYFKGIRDFDIGKAYEGIRKNLMQTTLLPFRRAPLCQLDNFYLAHGFYPALKPGEPETEPLVDPHENRASVAVTLGDSFDAWNAARLAHALGKEDDARYFLKRAANYQNVFRKEKGCMWPRSEDGKWIEGIDPNFSTVIDGRDYFDECNGNVYNWMVQHDIKGLIELMGGREQFTARLDQLFEDHLGPKRWKFQANYPDSTGLVGQFVMGNEPDFHVPYLYNYSGAPWKTQKRVRMLLDVWFKDTIFGIPGDEDGGGMSAFVVFTAMGFYPVTPGLPVYTIGSPIFQKVAINLENGKKFTVLASKSSAVNKYIQSAKLNGQPLNRPWFTHQDVMNGSTLELEMGPRPNPSWGADPAAAPPSALQLDQ